MKITDEILMAYADNELDAQSRSEVERAMIDDATIADRIQRHRQLRAQLSSEFAPIMEEPIPDRLRTIVEGTNASQRTIPPESKVVDLSTVRQAKPQRMAPRSSVWLATAASLIVGIMIGFAFFGPQRSPFVADRTGFIANGSLAKALSEQSATYPVSNANVQIGMSYLARSGDYCRTFVTHSEQALAGLACREEGGWRIKLLAPSSDQPSTEYRTAASSLPSAIVNAATEDMQGEALDVEQEAQVMAKGWRKK